MAAKSNAASQELLKFLFNSTVSASFAGIFGAPTTPLTHFYIALHTDDPTFAAANQTINEVTYAGYSRVPLLRTTANFTVTGTSVSPVANIDFAPSSSAPVEVATHFSIGTTASGSLGKILYTGAITPTISINLGTIPRLTPATAVSES